MNSFASLVVARRDGNCNCDGGSKKNSLLSTTMTCVCFLANPAASILPVTQARYIDERQESTRTKQQLTNVKAPLLTQPSSAIEYKCVMSTAVKKPAKTLQQTSRRTRTVSGKNVMVRYKLFSEFKIIIFDTAH